MLLTNIIYDVDGCFNWICAHEADGPCYISVSYCNKRIESVLIGYLVEETTSIRNLDFYITNGKISDIIFESMVEDILPVQYMAPFPGTFTKEMFGGHDNQYTAAIMSFGNKLLAALPTTTHPEFQHVIEDLKKVFGIKE